MVTIPPPYIIILKQTASQDLILSACTGNLPHLKALVSSGAVHIDVVDRLGHSPLFAAALHSHVEVVQFLLNEGADVNRLAMTTQYSPLSACCHLLYRPTVGHTKVGLCHVRWQSCIRVTLLLSCHVTQLLTCVTHTQFYHEMCTLSPPLCSTTSAAVCMKELKVLRPLTPANTPS